MARVTWDGTGQRLYETGTDRGMLYLPDDEGVYSNGVAWNGLTSVTESPSGDEPNAQYADNIKYLNLLSLPEFGGTIEAFTSPDEFGVCDGTAEPVPGVAISQQGRSPFGFAYRTRIGNDVHADRYGYKLHLVYGALAAPSEKNYNTINDSPEAMNLSWEFSTTPVEVGVHSGIEFAPTSLLVIDSTKHEAAVMAEIEAQLYGSEGTEPNLPKPGDIIDMFGVVGG